MDANAETKVTVTDIKMPFMSMVAFMVKSSIAAIPALIILTVIGMATVALLGGMVGGLAGHTGRF